jgi:hypothetical protein
MGVAFAKKFFIPGKYANALNGIEYILILHGSQIDGDKVYTLGTLVIHGSDTHHNLKFPEGCIALGIWQKPVMLIYTTHATHTRLTPPPAKGETGRGFSP